MILPLSQSLSRGALAGPDAPHACSVPSPATFPALTGVRILAAYLVFWHHYRLPSIQGCSFLSNVFSEGHVGVAIFFVLSGFLVTYRYRDAFLSHKTTPFEYLWNRVARIYPLYFAVAIATLIIRKEAGLWDWFIQLTLTKGFFDQYKFSGVAQAWSLTVEERFYFSAPLLFLAFRRRRGMLHALLALYAVGAVCLLTGKLLSWHGLFGTFRFVTLYTFPGRAFEFLIGAKLATDILDKPQVPIKRPFKTYLGLFGITVALVTFACMKSPSYRFGLHHPGAPVVNNLLLPLAIITFLRGLLEEETLAKRILASPLFVLLGKSSYAFYLLHQGVLAACVTQVAHNPLVLFILVNIASLVAFKCYEEPMNLWLKSLMRRWKRRKPPDTIEEEPLRTAA
jgi:peptidoglycan/LPS O-acetylase OafA/YrhL